jgi:hypothetical protein
MTQWMDTVIAEVIDEQNLVKNVIISSLDNTVNGSQECVEVFVEEADDDGSGRQITERNKWLTRLAQRVSRVRDLSLKADPIADQHIERVFLISHVFHPLLLFGVNNA